MTRITALCVAVIDTYVAGIHIKNTIQIMYSLFWYFTQRRLLVFDVSGQHIGPVFFYESSFTLEDGTFSRLS